MYLGTHSIAIRLRVLLPLQRSRGLLRVSRPGPHQGETGSARMLAEYNCKYEYKYEYENNDYVQL